MAVGGTHGAGVDAGGSSEGGPPAGGDGVAGTAGGVAFGSVGVAVPIPPAAGGGGVQPPPLELDGGGVTTGRGSPRIWSIVRRICVEVAGTGVLVGVVPGLGVLPDFASSWVAATVGLVPGSGRAPVARPWNTSAPAPRQQPTTTISPLFMPLAVRVGKSAVRHGATPCSAGYEPVDGRRFHRTGEVTWMARIPAAPNRYLTVLRAALRPRPRRPLVRVGGLLTKGTPGDIVLPVARGVPSQWGAPPPTSLARRSHDSAVNPDLRLTRCCAWFPVPGSLITMQMVVRELSGQERK